MSLRKYMHPNNKYKIPPNFKELANIYPEFHENIFVDISGKVRYNFNSQESLRILTKTLLKHDFQLDVDIPVDKLVPALPLRLNYVLWIDDLMKHANLCEISGIDIGTGAIAVYPLLCAKMYGWKIIATDIDESTVQSARTNIEKNDLHHLINVLHAKNTTIIKSAVASDTYSFTMCNPPFFDVDDINNKKKKRTPPKNATTGIIVELIVDGGEKSFITKMIDESMELQNRVKIYTTMIGQKSSLAFCRSELKKWNIENTTWTEFCQGHTKRWGLAWSFIPREQLDLLNAPIIRTRLLVTPNKIKNQNMTELQFPANDRYKNVEDVIHALKEWISELQIENKELNLEDSELNCWTCHLRAQAETWCHARRKRRMAMQSSKINSKKLKTNEQINECLSETPEKNNEISEQMQLTLNHVKSESTVPFLDFTLGVGKLNEDSGDETDKSKVQRESIKICLIYHNGEGGKNALESFKQYLINQLGIREYFQHRNKRINSSKSPKKKRKRNKKTTVIN